MVFSSVATAHASRGSWASVSARACTPAAVSRTCAASSAAASRTLSGDALRPSRKIPSAAASPATAIARLRRLPTRKPKFIGGGYHSRATGHADVHGVIARLDLDVHRYGL